MTDNDEKNQHWKKTCSQLKQAFQAWDELGRLGPALSADEKRLQEMKTLLQELKGQIEALSGPQKPEIK